MKRVLMVSFDFPPQGGTGAIRMTKFAKYLPEFGWQPVVVSSDTCWNPDQSLARDIPPDTPIYRVGWPRWLQRLRPADQLTRAPAELSGAKPDALTLFKPNLAHIARRLLVPDLNVLWVKDALRACEQVLRNHPCDVMLTTAPPNSVHLVGLHLHRRLGIPWVADFRDVWTGENPALRKLGRLNWIRQQRMERRVLSNCDRAVFTTPAMGEYAHSTLRAVPASRTRIITNGFDPQDFAGPPPSLDPTHFVIAHMGTVLGPQTQNEFPEGLRLALLENEAFRRDVRLRFIGKLAPDYQARFAGLESNIEIAPFVSHELAIAVMRAAQVLLIVVPEGGYMTSPNKLFEYLAARRPILAIVRPGFISDLIQKERIGVAAPPDDASAIARALLAIYESVRLQPYGYTLSDAGLARFDRRALTRQLALVLEEIVAQ